MDALKSPILAFLQEFLLGRYSCCLPAYSGRPGDVEVRTDPGRGLRGRGLRGNDSADLHGSDRRDLRLVSGRGRRRDEAHFEAG